jgi:hypothetical protein
VWTTVWSLKRHCETKKTDGTNESALLCRIALQRSVAKMPDGRGALIRQVPFGQVLAFWRFAAAWLELGEDGRKNLERSKRA